jgi:hypothetical protein
MDIGLFLRSEGPEHRTCLVDDDAGFPHSVDAGETRDDVVPDGEDELELVMRAFLERESVTPGVGGERERQLELFSPSCCNP